MNSTDDEMNFLLLAHYIHPFHKRNLTGEFKSISITSFRRTNHET